jgi:hypothetical protein
MKALTVTLGEGEWRASHSGRFKPLNAELNPICHLLALLGDHHILHVGRIRVNLCGRAYGTE